MNFRKRNLIPVFLPLLLVALLATHFTGMRSASATGVGARLLEYPDSIVITPSPVAINIGEGVSMVAMARYSCTPEPCVPTPDYNITNDALSSWSSSDFSVASVSGGGYVLGVSAGAATIRITYAGVTGTASVTVNPPPEVPSEPGGAGAGGLGQYIYQPPTQEQTQETSEEPPPQEPLPIDLLPQEPPTTPPTIPGPPPPGAEEFAPSPQGELPPPQELPPQQPIGGGETGEGGEGGLPPPGEALPGQDLIPPLELPGELPQEVLVQAPINEIPPATYQDVNPILLPPQIAVTREEVTALAMQYFAMEENKEELIEMCLNNINECLSIFLSVSNYTYVLNQEGTVIAGIDTRMMARWTDYLLPFANAATKFDLGKLQLYPDLPPTNPRSYDVNLATLIAAIHGYYEEATSPFKPLQNITRIEAVKVILGTVDVLRWLFYDELETILGGLEGIKSQSTPFIDITPTREYMWWYPRYVNKACELNVITCKQGTKFRPDQYITKKELADMLARMKKYLEAQDYLNDQTADPDGDTIKTYLEDSVFFTNPYKADTDSDRLRDDEELFTYRTSPFLKDSDSEGLGDYEEVKIYGTNPLNIDTDGDEFNDFIEIKYGTDPLDPDSYPRDKNKVGVADDWQEQFNIDVLNGQQDTDGDGLSDKLEFQIGTNPLLEDSDNDGFPDALEVLDYRTDPNDPNDPGTLDNIGVKITNFTENQLVGDNTPMIKGVAPVGSTVRLVIRNDYGHEKVLGDTYVDDNSVFIYQVAEPIRNGRYMLVAKAMQAEKKKITVSMPVHIIIDSSLNVSTPVPKKLADQPITEEVILKNVRLEIKDSRPVLVGETEYGNKVTATWRSIVTTSALIADSVGGEFSIAAPRELELGKHEVYVQATRKKDNAQSDTIKILFNVGVAFPGMAQTLQPAAWGGGEGGFGSFPWLWILLALAIIILGIYFFYKKREDEEADENKTK